jgi:hypothetical protein
LTRWQNHSDDDAKDELGRWAVDVNIAQVLDNDLAHVFTMARTKAAVIRESVESCGTY